MWSPSFRRASRSLWRPRRPRTGVLGPRTAAMTLALLELFSLRKPLGQALARARPRTRQGLAFATLGGATLRFFGAQLGSQVRRRHRRVQQWVPRASKALREPVEAALAMAMLSALALPLMVEAPPEAAPTPRPGGSPPLGKSTSSRSVHDAGDNGDDLDFEAAIASW